MRKAKLLDVRPEQCLCSLVLLLQNGLEQASQLGVLAS